MTTAFDKDLELIFQKLTSDRQVKQALDFLKQDAPNTIAQQKELVVIEAPTFQEKQQWLQLGVPMRQSPEHHYSMWIDTTKHCIFLLNLRGPRTVFELSSLFSFQE